jgi:hypothetical protein
MQAGQRTRRRRVLTYLKGAVGTLDLVAGAPPGDKGAGQRRVIEIDRDRVVQDAVQTICRHRPAIRTAVRIEPCTYLIDARSEAMRWYANPDAHWEAAIGVADQPAGRPSSCCPVEIQQAWGLRTRCLALAEVAAADLDITVVGQLSAPQLALDDQLKPGPVQVVRLKSFLGRHGAIDEAPEDISRHADHALVLADADAKLDGP